MICRLSDLRFVKLNEGFLELTGYRREDVLGRSIYEIDVLERAERREYAIERLKAGETIPQMEACLRCPRTPSRLVIVAGQPIEIGDEPCMLFTFADLEPRRKAETALRQSEERFAKSFRLSPVPTIIGTGDASLRRRQRRLRAGLSGYAAEDVVGAGRGDLRLWADARARRRFERSSRGPAACGASRRSSAQGRRRARLPGRRPRPCHQRRGLHPMVFQDITERKRTEAELVEAIEAVMADTSWFSRGVIEKLAALRQPARPAPAAAGIDQLTPREREILGLICRGAGDAEIAASWSSRATRCATTSPRSTASSASTGARRVIWAREHGIATANLPARQPQRPKK